MNDKELIHELLTAPPGENKSTELARVMEMLEKVLVEAFER